MPTRKRQENELIALFLSAYDNDTWKNSDLCWLDEKGDGTVEVLATRRSDGMTLAIEHTLIQPYDKFKREFSWLNDYDFRSIERDLSLVSPGRWVQVFVAAGEIRPRRDWNSIKTALHDWLRCNLSSVPVGDSNVVAPTPDGHGCKLLFRVKESPSLRAMLNIGIDGAGLPVDSLDVVVRKALETKLPKLLKINAAIHMLLLERNEFTLGEDQILRVLESHCEAFPQLEAVDVWFMETTSYPQDRAVMFYLFDRNGHHVASLSFQNGELLSRVPF